MDTQKTIVNVKSDKNAINKGQNMSTPFFEKVVYKEL